MILQPQKGADGHAHVVALRFGVPRLAALHRAELLQPPVVVLYAPRQLRYLPPGHLVHPQVAADPVLRVTVCGHDPERLDQPETLQVDYRAARRDRQFADGTVALAVQVDAPVAPDLSQEQPAVPGHRLEVVLARVPHVERHVARPEAAPLGLSQHGTQVVVLGEPLALGGVREAAVEGAPSTSPAPPPPSP